MDERDYRVIENMARTGMDLEDLCSTFKRFPADEIEQIYNDVKKERDAINNMGSVGIKCNCS